MIEHCGEKCDVAALRTTSIRRVYCSVVNGWSLKFRTVRRYNNNSSVTDIFITFSLRNGLYLVNVNGFNLPECR